MKAKITNKIIGYHYSNPEAYKSMKTNGIDGYITFNFDNFAGLIPGKRFICPGYGTNLPKEAYACVIEGLLEPEPKSWLENKEFPNLWKYLMYDICKKNEVMHDICRKKEIMLLSFELKSKDKAYIVERANVERELYRDSKGLGKPTKETMDEAFKKYWESRIPVFDYKGGYSVPQLTIWTGIEFNRLNVEWVKSTNKVWQKVLKNNAL